MFCRVQHLEVIYSCTGRAANKTPEDGIEHMATELERSGSWHGPKAAPLCQALPKFVGAWADCLGAKAICLQSKRSKAWVLDFAGFGLADCNPKVAAVTS